MTIYPDDTKIWGVDVSFYQDDNDTPRGIDFNEMKEQGASFVFIRAGQNTWVDPDFIANWTAAREAGLPRGAYWFLDARIDGRLQGGLFRSLLEGDWGELPPVVDYEHAVRVPVTKGKNGRTYSEWRYNTPVQLHTFLSKLQSPRTPMIYTGYYYWAEHGSDHADFGVLPLWIAAYGDEPRVPFPWKKWTFWQFTDNGPGKVLGAESHRIDLNYFQGTQADFDEMVQRWPVPVPHTHEFRCVCDICGIEKAPNP